jgi:hypothetical protein
MKKITPEILKQWEPCSDGYRRFIELLPEGGTLSECIDALVKDGHANWGHWLFNKCRQHDEFKDQTAGGYRNSGDRNSGDCNSGGWNSGCFNTITPQEILIFNKPCKREIWENCQKPDFIYFNLTIWINEFEMSDQEKIDNPKFYVASGYLKTYGYKEAWKKSWDNASLEDRKLILTLPNFDPEVFKEISGIDVIAEGILS